MTEQESWLRDHLAVHAYTLFRPWLWWQFLTAGFDHAADVQHILWNMVGLFIFGREVEQVYGGKEFLRLYLAMVVFASLVWCVLTNLAGESYPGRMRWSTGWPWGHPVRSPAWSCFTPLHFPRRTILFLFIIPMPAWLFGILLVGWDMMGATHVAGASKVAYSMHLAGAAFAFVYYRRRWNLTGLSDGLFRFHWPSFPRRPRLHIHRPDEPPPSDLSAEVDRILEKIYREGETSLTAKERKTLEAASRQYQQRVKADGGSSRRRH